MNKSVANSSAWYARRTVQDGVCGVDIFYTGTRLLYKTEQKHAVTFWRCSCLRVTNPFPHNQFHQPTDFTGDFQTPMATQIPPPVATSNSPTLSVV